MKNILIHTQNSAYSSVAFDDECLMISEENQNDSFEELVQNIECFHRSETNGYKKILLENIKELMFRESHFEFYIKYINKKNRLSKYYFSIKDDELRRDFCQSLATNFRLNNLEKSENRFARIGVRFFLIGIISVLTWFLSSVAINGIGFTRRVSSKVAAEFLQWVGPNVVVAVGLVLILLIIFKILKTAMKPGTSYLYTKS